MAVPSDEHERSLAFADIALQQIRALRQPASPRNYEIWYHYATGYNSDLNRSINHTLAQKGALEETDIEDLHDKYFSANRTSTRIDALGSRVLDEINQVLGMIDAAAGTATTYSESLADASQTLQGHHDGGTLRAIVESLVAGAREMEINNKKLEARLSTSRQEIEQLQQNLEMVRTESLTDPLTGLANRKLFDAELSKAMERAKQTGEPLALLMCDVDNFKAFNDRYGHLTGDQVLRLVGISVKQNVKGRDIAARYGGEEFAVALPNTALLQATTVADHIRHAIMTKELIKRSSRERLGRVTISIGVAVVRPSDSTRSLIERADTCLYAAKRNGRNRVISESDPETGRDQAARVA